MGLCIQLAVKKMVWKCCSQLFMTANGILKTRLGGITSVLESTWVNSNPLKTQIISRLNITTMPLSGSMIKCS